jgi:hypothetical protein
MYKYTPINELITGAEEAAKMEIIRYGVIVYVDSDPDFVGADFLIDPNDKKGIEIFRRFAKEIAEHFKTLI